MVRDHDKSAAGRYGLRLGRSLLALPCRGIVTEISEPVAEDRSRSSPGCDIRTKREARQFDAQRKLAFGARALLEACKLSFGPDVEIAGREGRKGLPLAGEKAGYVAQIFPLQ